MIDSVIKGLSRVYRRDKTLCFSQVNHIQVFSHDFHTDSSHIEHAQYKIQICSCFLLWWWPAV